MIVEDIFSRPFKLIRRGSLMAASKNWKFLLPAGEGEDEGNSKFICLLPLTLTLSRGERELLEVP